MLGFQSTLPRRERHINVLTANIGNIDFNPRSREGSDIVLRGVRQLVKISIHAPAKGATGRCCSTISILSFQSTLPRRERPRAVSSKSLLTDFNPRSREGSDRTLLLNNFDIIISIHAPAKGATAGRIIKVAPDGFQSTLPRRERQFIECRSFISQHHFNPRSREGSDLL